MIQHLRESDGWKGIIGTNLRFPTQSKRFSFHYDPSPNDSSSRRTGMSSRRWHSMRRKRQNCTARGTTPPLQLELEERRRRHRGVDSVRRRRQKRNETRRNRRRRSNASPICATTCRRSRPRPCSSRRIGMLMRQYKRKSFSLSGGHWRICRGSLCPISEFMSVVSSSSRTSRGRFSLLQEDLMRIRTRRTALLMHDLLFLEEVEQ